MNIIKSRLKVFTNALFFISSLILFVPTNVLSKNQIISKKEQEKVITKISKLLKDKYVFPLIAEKSSRFIQKQFEAGIYNEVSDLVTFSKKLTEDLQSVSHDSHMVVRVRKSNKIKKREPEIGQMQRRRIQKRENYGFKKVELLEGNVGYLNFSYFSRYDIAKETVIAAFSFLSNADAIIIDLRTNSGGSFNMVKFITSHFFEKKTLLEKRYLRKNNHTEEVWTLDRVPGKRLDKIPLYVLTSGNTISGGEALAFHLKTHKRATIIGETTFGAANQGRSYKINKNYNIFISRVHSVSSVTGTNWEGIGVTPDIKVSSDMAIEKAYALARVAAKSYGERRFDKKVVELKKAFSTFIDAEQKLSFEEAKNLIYKKLDTLVNKWSLDEPSLNDMGYRFLWHHKNPTVASIVFQYNLEAYSDSYNVYGSLADSYVELGKIQLAIKNYKKALEIYPDDDYSKERLKTIDASLKSKS